MKRLAFILMILFKASLVSAQNNADSPFTYTVGEFDVILLSEGQQNGKKDVLIGATTDMFQQYAPEENLPMAINAFLVKTPEKNILVDTGLGIKLFQNMHSIGIEPAQIDAILITHMHGDHIGGMLQNDNVAFSNAEIYISQPEYDYWMSDDAMNQLPEGNRGGFIQARKVIDAYKNRLHLFQPDNFEEENIPLFSGFHGISTYGHTPGHTSYLVESNGDKILIWGDIMHMITIQMPHPEVAVTYDVNPQQAITTRMKALEYVTKNNVLIAGMHIPFSGMGTVSKTPQGYEFHEKSECILK